MKYFYLAVPQNIPIPCFCCGKVMGLAEDPRIRQCLDCKVTELPLQGEYVIMTREHPAGKFFGVEVEYIDHSREHCPHP